MEGEYNQGGVQQQGGVLFLKNSTRRASARRNSSVLHPRLFTVAVIIASGPACCPTLYFFQLENIFLSV